MAEAKKPKATKKTAHPRKASSARVKKETRPKVLPEVADATPKQESVREAKSSGYLYAVGRRKTSTVQVRLFREGSGKITVNEKPYTQYFPTLDMQKTVLGPLVAVGYEKKVNVEARARGGGIHSQAEALRHAIARSLLLFSSDLRTVLKKNGFLTRDPRMKERKKPGLKRARRAPQWQKR
jgi:small subunit ribosomal protein S9